MKKNLLLFICAFVAQLAFAQAQAVKGTVLDSSGEPVMAPLSKYSVQSKLPLRT